MNIEYLVVIVYFSVIDIFIRVWEVNLGFFFNIAGINVVLYNLIKDWCKSFLNFFFSYFWKVEVRFFGKDYLLFLYCK